MGMESRRWLTLVEQRSVEAGRREERPLRKVAAIAVVSNPFVDRYVEELDPLIRDSVEAGALLARLAIEAMGGLAVESHGKAGVVGVVASRSTPTPC